MEEFVALIGILNKSEHMKKHHQQEGQGLNSAETETEKAIQPSVKCKKREENG